MKDVLQDAATDEVLAAWVEAYEALANIFIQTENAIYQQEDREHEDGLSKPKVRQAVEYIQANLGEDLSLSEIAHELGMSQYYFCHLFKRSTGISPHQYLIQQRVERAKHLLKRSQLTITAILLKESLR